MNLDTIFIPTGNVPAYFPVSKDISSTRAGKKTSCFSITSHPVARRIKTAPRSSLTSWGYQTRKYFNQTNTHDKITLLYTTRYNQKSQRDSGSKIIIKSQPLLVINKELITSRYNLYKCARFL